MALRDQFEHFSITQIPIANNSVANRLAKVASAIDNIELLWEVQRRLIEVPTVGILVA